MPCDPRQTDHSTSGTVIRRQEEQMNVSVPQQGRGLHTVTLCLLAKALTAATEFGAIPTTVMPDSLNSTFSKWTRPPNLSLVYRFFSLNVNPEK
jgi:hypothetical protein